MRIWQRSAIASTRWPLVSLIRNSSVREGTTAYRSARAPVQSKTSSATSGLLCQPRPRHPAAEDARPRADLAEEVGDARPRLFASVKAAPVQPHPPGELVAGVDRHEEVLDVALGAADQRRLHVRFDGAEQGM